jgi:hypothetical protein
MTADEYRPSVVAESSGLCPLCCRWIVAGKSHISPIGPRVQPDPYRLVYSPFNATWAVDGLRPVSIRARGWGHARCVAKFETEHPTWHERCVIADERRVELKRVKKQADAALRSSKPKRPAIDREQLAA